MRMLYDLSLYLFLNISDNAPISLKLPNRALYTWLLEMLDP